MAMRIHWKQTVIAVNDLPAWLTAHNMQPNNFKLCNLTEDIVLVVYVDKKVPNEE